MDNTHEDTHLIDTQEPNIEDSEIEKEKFFEDTNEIKISEEELENIHPYFNHNFPTPTMNSVPMTVNHNDPENFIDYKKYFFRYRS